MSSQPRLQPTRRTVLRTAAWTAPAVSIAVAAPAFASASLVPKGDVSAVSPDKFSDGSDKYVRWDLWVTNTGSTPITTLTVVFSFLDNGSESAVLSSVINSTSGSWTWSGLTASWTGSLGKTPPLGFRAVFTGGNNAGGSVLATVSSGSTILGTTSGTWN